MLSCCQMPVTIVCLQLDHVHLVGINRELGVRLTNALWLLLCFLPLMVSWCLGRELGAVVACLVAVVVDVDVVERGKGDEMGGKLAVGGCGALAT